MHSALEAALHETLDELDLTMPLADALWQLDPAHGPVSRRALAERLRCDPSNVTYLVDRLPPRPPVRRPRAAGGRRTAAVTLTPAGIDARDRLITTIAESRLFLELTDAEQR